jgi:hypothetical protein
MNVADPRLSPLELDLDFALLVIELDLELEFDLVWHMDLEMHTSTVELDVIVAGEGVGESVQASGGVLSAQPLLLADLQ